MADQRIPTAYRVNQGTGYRGNTGMRDVAFNSVGYQDVNVMDRPVTQQGISGIKTAIGGPGRVVYDKTYYISQIRQKNAEIRNEVAKFIEEIDQTNRDNGMYLTLEKKYDDLIKEVRNLEGQLADYNLALDKQRTETRSEDVIAMYEHVKMQNDRQKSVLDELFLERKQMEEQIGNAENEIAKLNAQAEERLGDLDPEQRQEYINLQDENRALEDEIQSKRTMLENINQQMLQADAALRTDVLKQKAHQLREQKAALLRKKGDLEMQTNELNLSFPEARERLLNRVKSDNAEIKDLESRTAELKKASANYKKQAEEMQYEMNNTDTSELEKYELLYQKDRDMTEFMDKFEETKAKELDMIKQIEENIVILLDHQSRSIDRGENLPGKEQVQEWESDYQFKKDEMVNAAVTQERLKIELEEKKAYLTKFRGLDERISKETEEINKRMTTMRDELTNKFNDIEGFRQKGQQQIYDFQALKESLRIKKEHLTHEVRSTQTKLDTKRQMLNDNPNHKALEKLETDLSQNEQTIYSIRAYIDSKGAETNYKPVLDECSRLTREINIILANAY